MSNKNLEYYKNLEYDIIIKKEKIDDESWYFAYTNELGKYACFGKGKSQIEAINNFHNEKNIFLEFLFNSGKNINEPKEESEVKYSGFFNVRTSPIMHASLVFQAKELDISLNLYINQILSAAVENKKFENTVLNKLGELCGKLDAHHFIVTRQLKYQTESIKSSLNYNTYSYEPDMKVA